MTQLEIDAHISREGENLVSALQCTLPILCAFLPLGIAFGLVVHEYNLPPYVGALMSFFIYAGSAEFVAAAMLASSASLFEIAVAGFCINFRHIFYGLSVSKVIPKSGLSRIYSICTLSDETYALFLTLNKNNHKYAPLIAFLNHMYWFLSVCLGLIMANSLNFDFSGVEFCLPALFIVLSLEQWKNLKEISPFLISALSSSLAFVLFRDQFLVTSIGLSCLLILFLNKMREART